MASTIAAVTTSGGGVITTADSSGNLSLLSGATTVVAVTSAGATVTGTLAATGAVSGTTGTFTSTLGVTGAITGSSTVAGSTGILYPLTSGTAVASTSGTSIDFTSIPSWVKRITVMFNGVSTNGTSPVQIQIGDSGGAETSGYTGSVATITGSSATFAFSAGFLISSGGGEGAATVRYGSLIISKVTGNTYSCFGNISYGSSDTRFFVLAGNKDLSDTLDRIRITTVNGTDTFDAGSVNILYE